VSGRLVASSIHPFRREDRVMPPSRNARPAACASPHGPSGHLTDLDQLELVTSTLLPRDLSPHTRGPRGLFPSGVLVHEQLGDQACSGRRVGGLGAVRGSVLRRAGPRRQSGQARKAWVPNSSCWEPRPGGGAFSSGPALARRGSVGPVLPCDPGHDKDDLSYERQRVLGAGGQCWSVLRPPRDPNVVMVSVSPAGSQGRSGCAQAPAGGCRPVFGGGVRAEVISA